MCLGGKVGLKPSFLFGVTVALRTGIRERPSCSAIRSSPAFILPEKNLQKRKHLRNDRGLRSDLFHDVLVNNR